MWIADQQMEISTLRSQLDHANKVRDNKEGLTLDDSLTLTLAASAGESCCWLLCIHVCLVLYTYARN